MSTRNLKLAAAAAAWIAMTAMVAAQPMPTAADTPTGDVWVTPDAPTPTPLTAQAQRTPVYRQLPTGDFWPAEGDATRAADTPAPPRDALAREQSATGGVK
jgi:hypothetical protein